MEKKLITEKSDYQQLWNSSNASILQSWNWGAAKSSTWNVARYSIDKYPIQIFIKKLPLVGKNFGYMPRAFLNLDITDEFLEQLIEIAKIDLNLSHLVIDPHLDINKSEVLGKNGFIDTGTTIQPNQTNLVDLPDPNDPWMAMKGKYRRNIKKSKRDGCVVEILEHGDEAVERFYKVMEEVFARTSYIMYGLKYFKDVWNSLTSDRLARIYMAKKGEKDVGAYLVTFDNTYAYEFYGGVTNDGRDVEAGYLLKWEGIKDAKSMGKLYYDHWGIAPYDEEGYEKGHELYNISRFKEGFGGRKVRYSSQKTIIFDAMAYKVFSLGKSFNKLVLKLKKLF